MSRYFRAYNEEKDEEVYFSNFSFVKKYFGGKYFKEGSAKAQGLPIKIHIIHKQKSVKGGKWLIDYTEKIKEEKSVSYHSVRSDIYVECSNCSKKVPPGDHYCSDCYLEELGVKRMYQDSQNEFRAQIQSTKQAK